MAIEPVLADVIRKLVPKLPNTRVLCLGYPDILTLEASPLDEERISIAKWHHWKGGVEHAGHFFGSHNLDAEYWDVTKARGPEYVVDFNGAVDWPSMMDDVIGEAMRREGRYGLAIDPGTLEHIANIGNCWRTLCTVISLGGYAVHVNPLAMGNHGFYSIHPTAYVDIYEANGFKIEMMAELSGPLENRIIRPVPSAKRFHMAQDGVMLVVAKKTEEIPFTWPIQAKYRSNPTLKG